MTYMFKNETHNHPTEIEPFGGAATCLGGAIRDPLSGRVYVYQAMRVTGAADPRATLAETRPGKLPQRKITIGAAHGYSSYGNQIGLATGLVDEVYHPNYVAKRMEVGAVIGAAPADHVKRSEPQPGDVVILVGGRTGRDGMGGATGSSKKHTTASLSTCGAEVQKGNPPVERNIQRLFRRKEVATLIKRCNDFGAGGVSVAIGELADGLDIDLDQVRKKYDGLDGTEIAISESQERMQNRQAKENCREGFPYSRQFLLCAVPRLSARDGLLYAFLFGFSQYAHGLISDALDYRRALGDVLEADDRDYRRFLQQRDELVAERGQDILERLRHDDEPHERVREVGDVVRRHYPYLPRRVSGQGDYPELRPAEAQ